MLKKIVILLIVNFSLNLFCFDDFNETDHLNNQLTCVRNPYFTEKDIQAIMNDPNIREIFVNIKYVEKNDSEVITKEYRIPFPKGVPLKSTMLCARDFLGQKIHAPPFKNAKFHLRPFRDNGKTHLLTIFRLLKRR